MNTDHINPEREHLAQVIEAHGDHRVLRRVPEPFSPLRGSGPMPEGRCLAIVDTETSGLDPETDTIIELAIMLVFVADDGKVVGQLGPFSWLQDPGVPLDPKISLVTGLGAQHLKGQQINDRFALNLLDRADLIVAHNAAFDAGFIERRYPQIACRAWACSCSEIDWLLLGCEGRAQQHLLMQHGWFSGAHRAAADVWSLFWLLQHRRRDRDGTERSHLARLITASDRPGVMVQAERSPFRAKARLKARGYRWNADQRLWQIERPEDLVEHELAWAYRNGLPEPTTRPITACERHR